MAEQQQFETNMRGVAFPNEKKQKESAPDYKGQIEIDNKKFWLAVWVKSGRSNQNFLSMSFEEFTDKDYAKSQELKAPAQAATTGLAVKEAAGLQPQAPVVPQALGLNLGAALAALATPEGQAILAQLAGAATEQVCDASQCQQEQPPVESYEEQDMGEAAAAEAARLQAQQDFDDDIPF